MVRSKGKTVSKTKMKKKAPFRPYNIFDRKRGHLLRGKYSSRSNAESSAKKKNIKFAHIYHENKGLRASKNEKTGLWDV